MHQDLRQVAFKSRSDEQIWIGTAKNEYEVCPSPPRQSTYPACNPTPWARLFGAYRLALLAAPRRWEVGTPSNPDPATVRTG